MKKLFVLIPAIILLLTSCSFDMAGIFTKPLDALAGEEKVKIEQMSNNIIKCFTERDKAALKELFCEQIRNTYGFDEEIEKAFAYCQCDVYITSIFDYAAGGEKTIEYGKRTQWAIRPRIPYFEVLVDGDRKPEEPMEARYYSIDYLWHITSAEDRTLEGLQYITIERLNVDHITIGKDLSPNPITFVEESAGFDSSH